MFKSKKAEEEPPKPASQPEAEVKVLSIQSLIAKAQFENKKERLIKMAVEMWERPEYHSVYDNTDSKRYAAVEFVLEHYAEIVSIMSSSVEVTP